MSDVQQQDFSYFPGCSLATTATESNRSMMEAARILGLNLIELGGLELLRFLLGPDHVQEPEPGDGGPESVFSPGGAAPGGHVPPVSPLPALGPAVSEG